MIYVERDSQKEIVLGHKGETIRAIGQASRTEIAEILEQKVHLFLFVKVRENWGDDPERYREMGLEFPDRDEPSELVSFRLTISRGGRYHYLTVVLNLPRQAQSGGES